MKKIFQSILILFLLTLIPISFSEPTDTSQTASSTYTEKQLNITVTPTKPEFVLKLKSTPGTGYSWFLRKYNSHLIVPVTHESQQADTKLMGATGYEIWTFRVKPDGFTVPRQTTLEMIYARPWQGSEGATPLLFRIHLQPNGNLKRVTN